MIFQVCFVSYTMLMVAIPWVCTVLAVPCQQEGAGGFLGHCSTATSGPEHQQPPERCSWVSLHPEAGLVQGSQEEALPAAWDEQGFGRCRSSRFTSSFHSSVPIHKQGCAAWIQEDAVPLCAVW